MVCSGRQQGSQQCDAPLPRRWNILRKNRASLIPALHWDWEVQPLFSAPDRSRTAATGSCFQAAWHKSASVERGGLSPLQVVPVWIWL